MTFEIDEASRQLILLALAIMVANHRPGFDYAAGLAAERLGGRQLWEEFRRLNTTDEPDGRNAGFSQLDYGGES